MTDNRSTPVAAVPSPAADPRPGQGALPTLAVYPLRFTADAPAMIGFLRTLGMAPAVTAGADAFGHLVAGAGQVMIHAVRGAETGARGGDTDLCLAVADTDAAAAALRAEGFAVEVWDESYGRQGVLEGPAGERVALNETQRDLYGYQGHDPGAADARLSVTAVLSSDDFDRDSAWAARLGFREQGAGLADTSGTDGEAGHDDIEWFRALRGPGRAGAIGLHRPMDGGRRVRATGTEFGDMLQVRLGFETSEDLEQLATRLGAAGYPARVVADDGTRSVHVDDPDGQHLEIHPRPPR